MFNRDDMRQKSVSPHNIYETMSRSRKRMPGSTWCCSKSQKKGKQASSRKFRRKEHVSLHQGRDYLLPFKSFEVMRSWDLGGDGKAFFGFRPEEEWYVKLMRKWALEVMSIIENGNHLPRILAQDSRFFCSVLMCLPHHNLYRLVADSNDSDVTIL